ncbi:MAG: hypothetical protein J6W84_04955 [Bacteroidales bacterium]|nr:hypothetical protein [Bacteroidales bacterium]
MLDLDMRIEGEFTPEALEKLCGIQDHGPVQKAIDLACIDYMKAYWAYDTGRLANSAYSASDIGSGVIVYDTPYAWEMYLGIRQDGSPVNYHHDKNPMAGPWPFERMVADHENDILEEAKRVAGSQ